MGFANFGSLLILALFFRPLICQQLNTDGYFVSQFFQKMGLESSKDYNFSAPFCTWLGVFCDANKENVVKLVASGLGVSGVIADTTIGKLTKLQTLDLSNNKITGLPSDFWSLGSLKGLNLSFNAISGSLSSNIVNFVHLESLDLSCNYFSGNIPESIGTLSSLQVLKLNNNGFESSIPHGILECKSLVSIDISANKLSGSLHDGFGAACPKLKYFNVAGNAISGKASDFSGLASITYLNISGNFFEGSVVGLFQGPLSVVDLSRNQFEGYISQLNFSSSFILSYLEYVDLSENQLSGDFFAGLNDAHNLRHLNLAHNRFLQHELQHLGRLSGLEYLNLSETNLIGGITEEVSLLSSLRTLDLSKNHLNGSIPLLSVLTLNVLDVSYNNLSGEIPINLLGKLHGMERFNFSYNNLTFCGSRISHATLTSAFIGAVNSCPFAANPLFFKKEAPKHKGVKLALALTITMVCLLVFLTFLAFVFRRRRKTRTWEVKQPPYREEQVMLGPFAFQTDSTTWVADVKLATSIPIVIFEKPLMNFTFTDLLSATSHFDRGTLLAEGKFGPVYRGYLPGGIHVAVKVLVHGSTMTNEDAAREFEYLGRIKHPNLVPLAGYCLAGEQRICIYDYMENGNLQNLLHDLPLGIQSTDDWSTDTWEEGSNNSIQNVGSEGPLSNWRFRHKVSLGTARALAFLHHGCFPPIIHRDVKASSVYLDLNFEPRLSDFGLGKFFGNGLEDEIAHGSPGYAAPEFLEQQSGSGWTATTESDVYAFGIVLFEVITGKKAVGDDYPEEKEATLVGWVRGLIRKNEAYRAIDPRIRGSGEEMQMVEALKIGYLCTAEYPAKRPSMKQVVGLLKDIEPAT